LAIVAEAEEPLAGVLARHGLTYQRLFDAILEALARAPIPSQVVAAPGGAQAGAAATKAGAKSLWAAAWDRPAAGVPRRFGVAVMMILMAMYAVLFSAMRLLDAPVVVFVTIAVFVTGIGLGQMLLFGGRYPRAASLWVGAGLLPAEVAVLMVWFFVRETRGSTLRIEQVFFLPLLVAVIAAVTAPIGAFFGYLSGGLTAGVFFVLQKLGKLEPEGKLPEGAFDGPFDGPADSPQPADCQPSDGSPGDAGPV
jgi:hypothetical protein